MRFPTRQLQAVSMGMVRLTPDGLHQPAIFTLVSAGLSDAQQIILVHSGQVCDEVYSYELMPSSGCFNIPEHAKIPARKKGRL